MDKKLFKIREDIYKRCPNIFWEVSIFCIIFAIALVALDTVIPGLMFATFAILFFPVLYATFMTLYTIKFGGTVSLKSTFSIGTSYFKRNTFGCFRILKCFLHALLVDLIASTVMIFALNAIFTSIYGSSFTDPLRQAYELYINNSFDELNALLTPDSIVVFFLNCSSCFSFSISLIAFIFGIAFNSINVYLCASIPGATASFSTAVFNRFLKCDIRSYRKDFWSLNWPLFVLLPLGIIGGYVLGIGLDIDLTYTMPISSMMGLACVIPFAPYFFAGMEALFAKYNVNMRKASMDLTQGFLQNLKDNVNLSEEDKAKIEELLSKQNQNDDDNQSQG